MGPPAPKRFLGKGVFFPLHFFFSPSTFSRKVPFLGRGEEGYRREYRTRVGGKEGRRISHFLRDVCEEEEEGGGKKGGGKASKKKPQSVSRKRGRNEVYCVGKTRL